MTKRKTYKVFRQSTDGVVGEIARFIGAREDLNRLRADKMARFLMSTGKGEKYFVEEFIK